MQISTDSGRRLFFLVRRFHYLVGLFLIVELWILTFSGLMLNHPRWEISRFWERRTTTDQEVPLPVLHSGTPEERALELMQALELSGELESITWSQDSASFRVSVARPSEVTTLVVHPDSGKVEISKNSTDLFGLVAMLHTFNGVDFENGGRIRDWFITRLWTTTMDLLCVALIFWSLSGMYLWLSAGRERTAGSVALFAGFLLILLFLTVPSSL